MNNEGTALFQCNNCNNLTAGVGFITMLISFLFFKHDKEATNLHHESAMSVLCFEVRIGFVNTNFLISVFAHFLRFYWEGGS